MNDMIKTINGNYFHLKCINHNKIPKISVSFLGLPIGKHHKLGRLKLEQKFYATYFQRLKVQALKVPVGFLLEPLKENPFCAYFLSGGSWQSLDVVVC